MIQYTDLSPKNPRLAASPRSALLVLERIWPSCSTAGCPDQDRPLVPGFILKCQPIWHCLSCDHIESRQPRPDTPADAHTHHAQNASLPDEAFDQLLQAKEQAVDPLFALKNQVVESISVPRSVERRLQARGRRQAGMGY